MTENEDLLARIGQLAVGTGRINQHKNQSSQPHPASSYQPHHVSRHTPSHAGWAPYSRGRGRRPVAPHRHRTLVLNNAPSSNGTPVSSPGPASDNDGETRPATTSNGWVAKRDRHMQLINSAVYDKETQARAKAMEETRKMKALRRAEREQTKVLRYAQGTVPAGVASVPAAAQPVAHQILVNDVPFKIARGGSKLIRISSTWDHNNLSPIIGLPIIDDPNTANTTPKRVTVAGVAFVRSKNGNLHRLGAVTSKKTPNPAKKRDDLCKRFTTTGTCYKGPSCLYTHDPSKVALCKDFLQTGECPAGNSCDLSHEPSPHRSPFCMHFLRGRCSNPTCRYAHIRVTPGAPVCRAFATLGYCEKGAECTERHVHECPDYANSGVCHKKRCKLPHVDRAGQIRKAAAAKAEQNADRDRMDEDSDPSSEEEDYDAIDSDDVDSDEFDEPEELLDGVDSGETSNQQDFIHI
ncbi:hypothetical protein N7533_001719 [Penicillium manginii]|uniref:uncharacterized protein n=1 Tax=Penicillium manginii TaxID=203109 RepID=UPI00254984A2|nr:uncharacterized protein N7533_001719 [Penicillium manginii]KAJ5763038.1 hypothetical protein N7533_001719 [Penicillium manginii]